MTLPRSSLRGASPASSTARHRGHPETCHRRRGDVSVTRHRAPRNALGLGAVRKLLEHAVPCVRGHHLWLHGLGVWCMRECPGRHGRCLCPWCTCVGVMGRGSLWVTRVVSRELAPHMMWGLRGQASGRGEVGSWGVLVSHHHRGLQFGLWRDEWCEMLDCASTAADKPAAWGGQGLVACKRGAHTGIVCGVVGHVHGFSSPRRLFDLNLWDNGRPNGSPARRREGRDEGCISRRLEHLEGVS